MISLKEMGKGAALARFLLPANREALLRSPVLTGPLYYRKLILYQGVLRYRSRLMQPVTLEIEKQSSSNDVVLVTKLSGKLSLETVSNFLKPMRAESVPLLVLDLSGVAFLDSAGVGALVQLFVHRRNNSQKLALVALTQQGHAVMQVSGLTQLIPTYTSVAEVFSQSN